MLKQLYVAIVRLLKRPEPASARAPQELYALLNSLGRDQDTRGTHWEIDVSHNACTRLAFCLLVHQVGGMFVHLIGGKPYINVDNIRALHGRFLQLSGAPAGETFFKLAVALGYDATEEVFVLLDQVHIDQEFAIGFTNACAVHCEQLTKEIPPPTLEYDPQWRREVFTFQFNQYVKARRSKQVLPTRSH